METAVLSAITPSVTLNSISATDSVLKLQTVSRGSDYIDMNSLNGTSLSIEVDATYPVIMLGNNPNRI